jgi:hypothetical protein
MPFQPEPSADCENCDFGYCTSFKGVSREDRNTDFRFHQHSSWRCAFSDFFPGSQNDPYDETYDFYFQQMVQNAEVAGQHLYEQGRWDDELETHHEENPEADIDEHYLTPQQTGTVKGETYEMLVRGNLWNACAHWNRYVENDEWELDREEPDLDFEDPICMIRLKDNYDIKKLFTPEYRAAYEEVMKDLKESGTQLSFSTPDAVAIRLNNVPEEKRAVFRDPIQHFDEDVLDLIQNARQYVEGHLRPTDIAGAMGLKTSTRADRNYQFVFEANAWLVLFRMIFGLKKQRYYMAIAGDYGADASKAYSAVWLPSIELADGEIEAEAVIEDDIIMPSPSATKDRFYDTFLPAFAESVSDGVNWDLKDELDFSVQQDMDGWDD